MTDQQERLYTFREAAARLGCTMASIEHAANLGRFAYQTVVTQQSSRPKKRITQSVLDHLVATTRKLRHRYQWITPEKRPYVFNDGGFISQRAAAKLLRVSEITVRKMIDRGDLRVTTQGQSGVVSPTPRLRRSDVEALARKRATPQVPRRLDRAGFVSYQQAGVILGVMPYQVRKLVAHGSLTLTTEGESGIRTRKPRLRRSEVEALAVKMARSTVRRQPSGDRPCLLQTASKQPAPARRSDQTTGRRDDPEHTRGVCSVGCRRADGPRHDGRSFE